MPSPSFTICLHHSEMRYSLPVTENCNSSKAIVTEVLETSLVVQSPSHVQLFVTAWTAAHQASLSLTISQSLPKFMFIESVMSSNHLILCCPLLLPPSIFPSISIFSNESAVCIDGQIIRASASASVLPKSVQGWFPLRLVWNPCFPSCSQGSYLAP